jgi:hypothetical protein
MRADLDAIAMGVNHDGVQEVEDGVVVGADSSMLQTGIGRDRRPLRRARRLDKRQSCEDSDPMLCTRKLTSPSSQTRKTFMPALCMALHHLMSLSPAFRPSGSLPEQRGALGRREPGGIVQVGPGEGVGGRDNVAEREERREKAQELHGECEWRRRGLARCEKEENELSGLYTKSGLGFSLQVSMPDCKHADCAVRSIYWRTGRRSGSGVTRPCGSRTIISTSVARAVVSVSQRRIDPLANA